MTTAQLAQKLQTLAPAYCRDAPVVDRTGLTKTYDFTEDDPTSQFVQLVDDISSTGWG